MTPSWLEVHASYIDNSRTTTAHQLTFNTGSIDNAALLKVPIISPDVCKDSTPLTVEISIGQGSDSDIRYGVSDGTQFIGFHTTDKRNYGEHSPCFGMEGVSGTTLTPTRYEPNKPKPGAIIGDGDRKSWDARGPVIWDNFSIFRTNCAILTSYIRANPRTCRGF